METATRDRRGLVAALGGLIATLVTAAACVGPLLAIMLGVGGFGWLTRYAHLRVPASLLTAGLLLAGFHWVYRQGRGCPRGRSSTARVVLWLATLLALAVNVFEYVVFPRLL